MRDADEDALLTGVERRVERLSRLHPSAPAAPPPEGIIEKLAGRDRRALRRT